MGGEPSGYSVPATDRRSRLALAKPRTQRQVGGAGSSPIVLLVLLIAAFALACDREHDQSGGPPSAADLAQSSTAGQPDVSVEGVEPAPSQGDRPSGPLVAAAGEIEVTLADYRHEVRRADYMGRAHSPEALADPMFQRNTAVRLVKRGAAREALDARGIVISAEARQRVLSTAPELSYLAELDPDGMRSALEERGLTVDGLWRTIDDEIAIELLTDALLADIDEDELWARYNGEKSELGYTVYRFLNVPSAVEISGVVTRRAADIEARYRRDRASYQQAATATVRRFLVTADPGGGETGVAAAKKRAESFRERALAEDFAELAEKHSDDILSRGNGGLLQPVTERRMPQAFATEIGQISQVFEDTGGYAFVKVVSRTPASRRELDRATRREIASKLIQEAGAAPSVRAKASEVLREWRDNSGRVEALASEFRAERFDVGPYPAGSDGVIPTLGFVPHLHREMAVRTLKSPFVEGPIADGKYVYVAKLTMRTDATREAFEKSKDHYRSQLERELGPTIAWRSLDSALGSKIHLDLRVIQSEYGVLQKDGSIQPVGDLAPVDKRHK